MDNITDFLYLIGSVFAPMIAVQIASFFILNQNASRENIHKINLLVWALGFILYRFLMTVDLPVGNTLPTMIITALLCLAVNKACHF